MGPLEHIIAVLTIAIEHDEIGKAELTRTLGLLGGLVFDAGDANDNAELQKFSEEIGRRFDHVINPKP